MIHAASREATATLRERSEPVFARFSSADGLTGLADELYAIVAVLNAQPRLRRALSDPAAPEATRRGLAESLFDGKVSASAAQLLSEAVALRWSAQWDMLDAIEQTGDEALFVAAEQVGNLDEIEDQLFRFDRVIDAEGELVGLLDDQSVPAERRVALLDDVLGGKAAPVTRELLAHAVASERRRALPFALDRLLTAAATRRHRSIARVTSAVMLTDQQEDRLAAVLTEMYGRPITVRTDVEPSVRGGLIVRVGDEIIDGSIASRLRQARDTLAG